MIMEEMMLSYKLYYHILFISKLYFYVSVIWYDMIWYRNCYLYHRMIYNLNDVIMIRWTNTIYIYMIYKFLSCKFFYLYNYIHHAAWYDMVWFSMIDMIDLICDMCNILSYITNYNIYHIAIYDIWLYYKIIYI